MMEHQKRAIERLRAYTNEAESMMTAEQWNAASDAILGCWLMIDELRRGMPRPDPVMLAGL